jgi:hypothetical protein
VRSRPYNIHVVLALEVSMKRISFWSAAALCATLAVPALRADVKTREKTTFALEGVMGGLMKRFGGKVANEGLTSTVAVKGNRKSSVNDLTGEIIDLGEEKVYRLDVKKKEYTVKTFADLRAEYEKAKADAEKEAKNAKPEDKQEAEEAGEQLTFDIDVKKTGEKKTIAGYDAEEAIVTITAHEKGKSIEESGGFVLTNDTWLGPKIAALDELMQFQLKFVRAVYGEQFAADMQQMAGVLALYPSYKTMAAQLQTEGQKLQGTPLSTTTVFEAVKSAEQMKESESDSSGGGGLGGMFAKKLLSKNKPQQRAKVFTTTHDLLSIDTSVSPEDLAIPAGYKQKK